MATEKTPAVLRGFSGPTRSGFAGRPGPRAAPHPGAGGIRAGERLSARARMPKRSPAWTISLRALRASVVNPLRLKADWYHMSFTPPGALGGLGRRCLMPSSSSCWAPMLGRGGGGGGGFLGSGGGGVVSRTRV